MTLEADLKLAKTLGAYSIFASPQGEIVLADLEKVFGFSAQAFQPDSQGAYCPLKAAIRDGQRSVLLHIKSVVSRATATPTHEPTTKRTTIKE
jgi:hypothetical protein